MSASWDYTFDKNDEYMLDVKLSALKVALDTLHRENVKNHECLQMSCKPSNKIVQVTKRIGANELVLVPVGALSISRSLVKKKGSSSIDLGEVHELSDGKRASAIVTAKFAGPPTTSELVDCKVRQVVQEFMPVFWQVPLSYNQQKANMELKLKEVKGVNFGFQKVPVMTNPRVLKPGDYLVLYGGHFAAVEDLMPNKKARKT